MLEMFETRRQGRAGVNGEGLGTEANTPAMVECDTDGAADNH